VTGKLYSKNQPMNRLETDIQTIATAIKQITKADPMANNRLRETIDARFILFKIAREFLNLSLTKVGKLTNKHHATVLYGCRKFDDLIITDKSFKKNYQLVFKLMLDVELQSKIDTDEYIVDYVSLHEKYDELTEKYNGLLQTVEVSANNLIKSQFRNIHNSVIERILNDSNCSNDLSKTLRQVLVNKLN
jgi:hypothetical protein